MFRVNCTFKEIALVAPIKTQFLGSPLSLALQSDA